MPNAMDVLLLKDSTIGMLIETRYITMPLMTFARWRFAKNNNVILVDEVGTHSQKRNGSTTEICAFSFPV